MHEQTSAVAIARVLRQQTATLRVLIKSSARAWILVNPIAWTGGYWLILLAGVGIILDAVLAVRSRRGADDSFAAAALDVTESILWSALCPADQVQSSAVVLAAPTLLLAPIRSGVIRAAGLAGVVVLASGLARLFMGGAPNFFDSLIYVTIPVALGAAVLRLLVAELQEQRTQASAAAAAESRAADLLGRNDVVVGLGADRIDDLQTSIFRITGLGSDAAAARLRAGVAQHKADIAERTRAEGAYLWDTLLEHAAAVRAHQPAVTRHVFYDVPASARAIVLTKRQRLELLKGLDESALTGVHPVSVADEPEHLMIQVGPVRLALRTTPLARFRLSALPASFVAMALMVLTMSNPAYAATPIVVTIPAACSAVLMSYFLNRRVRAIGPLPYPWHVAAGLLVFAGTAVGVVTLTPPYDGIVLIGALVGLAFVLGVVPNQHRPRLLSGIALLAAAFASVAAAPTLSVRTTTAELIWPASAFLGALAVSTALAQLEAVVSDVESSNQSERRQVLRHQAAQDEARYLLRLADDGADLARAAAPGAQRDAVLADLQQLRSSISALMGG